MGSRSRTRSRSRTGLRHASPPCAGPPARGQAADRTPRRTCRPRSQRRRPCGTASRTAKADALSVPRGGRRRAPGWH
eukprot:763761-Lingulodinium_polyedra.AAC.1